MSDLPIQTLRLATRSSKLAIQQSETAKRLLLQAWPKLRIETVAVVSQGDKLSGPLQDHGGKDLFVNALRETIATGKADFACHSLKDVGTEASDFTLAAFLPRGDHRDALVGATFDELAAHANPVIGTASPRRTAQLGQFLPNATVITMRGNIDTRLAKLDSGVCTALMLACAGLERLSLQGRIATRLDSKDFVPAPGQGTIALECMADDQDTARLLAAVDDPDSNFCATAERACARAVGADCHTPFGALASICKNDRISIQLKSQLFHGDVMELASATGNDASEVGKQAARQLRLQGGTAPQK